MRTKGTLSAFDRYLARLGLRLDAVAVGGAALNLLGVISRPTKDCDIIHPELPSSIRDAARAFAADVRSRGEPLDDDWLNNGPSSLAAQLPAGWLEGVQPVFKGVALQLSCPKRDDLLRSKLFAPCDRGIDLADCVALAPTRDELQALSPWLEQQDGHPDWPVHVEATLQDLGRRLGHGV